MASSFPSRHPSGFSSEGFDLDAIPGSDGRHEDNEEIIYEVGGGVTKQTKPLLSSGSTPAPVAPVADAASAAFQEVESTTEKISSLEIKNENDGGKEQQPSSAKDTVKDSTIPELEDAEAHKSQGNTYFQHGDYEGAVEAYTAAVKATPGHPTGSELLEQRRQWREQRERDARQKLYEQDEKERQRRLRKSPSPGSQGDNKDNKDNQEEDDDDERRNKGEQEEEDKSGKIFRPNQQHPHAAVLAVYYSNRAAALQHLERWEEACQDCDIACLLNPVYTKAWMRKTTAHEHLDQTDQALECAQTAAALEPSNVHIQQTVRRLQKLEEERMERLKTETMDKLKDLGNSLLSNFGLSLDNFKAEKDPQTGSYSISFQQNK